MNQWNVQRKVDLLKPGCVETITDFGYCVSGDHMAHTWKVVCMNGNEAADLTGYSARGYFIRSDKYTVILNGAIEDNQVSCTLTSACYAVEGLLRGILRIEKESTGEIITVGAMAVRVTSGMTDDIVVTEDIIPSIETSVREYVQGAVSDWLEENITQETGYVLDTSLTVSGAAADAWAAGGILDNQYEETTLYTPQIVLPCNDDITGTFGGRVLKRGRVLYVDGAVTTGSAHRICVYGTLAYSSTAPSYANRPTWYNDPCDQFIVGHTYKFDAILLDGSIDTGSSANVHYFDIRTQAGSQKSVNVGDTWECTFQPEMVAFVLRNFTYTNAKLYLQIVDQTEQNRLAEAEERIDTAEEHIAAIEQAFPQATVTGSVVHVTDAAAFPAADLTVAIEAVQSGSGDPSPDNVRPITGFTAANIYRAASSSSSTPAVTVSFGAAGTVYGGTLDVTTGLLTVTWRYHDMGTITGWHYSDANPANAYYYRTFTDKKPGTVNLLASLYRTTNAASAAGMADFDIKGRDTDTTIFIKDSRYTSTDDLKAGLAGQQLIYELATPITYQLTLAEIAMLQGENYVWADTGDTTLTYSLDLNGLLMRIAALETQIANSNQ